MRATTLFNPLVYGGQSGEFKQGVHAGDSRQALAIVERHTCQELYNFCIHVITTISNK